MRRYVRFSDVRLAGDALLYGQAIGGTGKRIEGVKRGARGPRGLVRRCCFIATLSLLSACETLEISPFLKEQITGDTWRACLAREYQSQARTLVRNGRDWIQIGVLSGRGTQALSTGTADFGPVPAELNSEAQALQAAISASGKTCACATAQARLDAWSVNASHVSNRNPADFASSFQTALTACKTHP